MPPSIAGPKLTRGAIPLTMLGPIPSQYRDASASEVALSLASSLPSAGGNLGSTPSIETEREGAGAGASACKLFDSGGSAGVSVVGLTFGF